MRTCDNCACDRVCDHNWNGFENCGNWISMDAVPVVRCKDCARCVTHKGVPICNKWRTFPEVELDGFCSYGERKEGAE